MAKWRDAEGQHQVVLGRAWTKRGRPPPGYLTKAEARRELDEILADARRTQLVGPPRRSSTATIAEAAHEWLRSVEFDRKRRPSTIYDYTWIVERILIPDFGEAKLESITAQQIDAWRVGMAARGAMNGGELSGRTINKYLGAMHSILKRAQRTRGLAANAAASAERQPVRRTDDFDALSAAEVEALGRAVASPQDAAIFLTTAYTGLRLGELRSLRWRDLAFEKRLIHVRRSDVFRREDAPKSGRVRSVPMVDQVLRALDELSRRERWTDLDDLVFVNPEGKHIEDLALRRRFYAALETSDVKAYMGHADISTTMIYVHHVPQVDAAEKLSAALSESATPATV
jgi:integrase